MFSADAEHDLQMTLRTGVRCGRGHEVEEFVGFIRASRNPECLHREAGVADPRVAAVPVAFTADFFGQGCRGRSHDRTGGLVTQRLEDPDLASAAYRRRGKGQREPARTTGCDDTGIDPVKIGTTMPYSGRGRQSISIVTRPLVQSAPRSKVCGAFSPRRCGSIESPKSRPSRSSRMASSVWKVVWSAIVPSTYERVDVLGAVSRSDQCPASSSKMDAKTDSLSNRGKHSQTMEPSLVTNAAVPIAGLASRPGRPTTHTCGLLPCHCTDARRATRRLSADVTAGIDSRLRRRRPRSRLLRFRYAPERDDQCCRGLVPQKGLAAFLGPIHLGSGQRYKDVTGTMNETDHLAVQTDFLNHVAKIDNCQRDDSDHVVKPR